MSKVNEKLRYLDLLMRYHNDLLDRGILVNGKKEIVERINDVCDSIESELKILKSDKVSDINVTMHTENMTAQDVADLLVPKIERKLLFS